MKAFFKIFLCFSLFLLSLFTMLSCGDDKCEAHQWDEGVIKETGTCKENGKRLYTCTVCGETLTEEIPGEHQYEKDVCTLCGFFNDKIKNPNLLLIDSIFNDKGLTLSGENVRLTVNDIIDLSFSNCGFNVKIENSFLVGEAWLIGTSFGEEFNARAEFKDEMIYLYGSDPKKLLGTKDEGAAPLTADMPSEEPHSVFSQKELLKALPLNLYSALFESKDNTQSLGSMWDSLIKADNNIVDKKLNTLLNLVFIKSKTVDEYRFNINPSLVKSLLESAKIKSTASFIDIILGKNFYKGALSLSLEILNKTIAQIETVTKTTLASYGISVEAILSIIEDVADINIDKELDEIRHYKVFELINEYRDDKMELDEYKKLILTLDEKLNETTLFNLVINPFLEKYLTLTYDEIAEIIMYLVDSSSLQIIATPSYELIKIVEKYDGVVIDEEINGKEINVSFSGSFVITPNK